MSLNKEQLRKKRHFRVRKNLLGTAQKPRLNVFRSLENIYAQLIDDDAGVTIAAASTLDSQIKSAVKSGGNIEAAKLVGKLIAEKAAEKGIANVAFDRGGYKYHGRVAALADGAREGGLKF